MENKFINAIKNGYRYTTNKGLCTTEDLFSMNLQSKDGFNLDNVARTIFNQIKESDEVSFVSSSTKKSKELEEKLEIVKFVIASKIEDRNLANKKAEQDIERKRLKDLIAEKRLNAVAELSVEELEAKLNSLG